MKCLLLLFGVAAAWASDTVGPSVALVRDLPAVNETASCTSESLKTDRQFGSHRRGGWESVNELVQNLYDQALVSCGANPVEVNETNFSEGGSVTTWDFYCLTGDSTSEFKVVASLSWGQDKPKWMLLTNFGSTLPLSAFSHGHSSKRNNPRAIGFFGDGLKLALARLRDAGVNIRIFSNHSLLGIEYQEEHGHESLFLSQCPLLERAPDIDIHLANLPCNAFDPARYLFLKGDSSTAFEKAYGVPEKGSIRVVHSNHSGEIFVKQVFLEKALSKSLLQNLSIDIHWPNSILAAKYGLTRDRKHLDEKEKLVARLFIDILSAGVAGFAEFAFSRIAKIKSSNKLDHVVVYNTQLSEYIYKVLESKEQHLFIQLVDQFLLPNVGDKKIVICKKVPEIADVFGMDRSKYIILQFPDTYPSPLYNLAQEVPRFLSEDELVADVTRKLDSSPAYIPATDEDRMWCSLFEATVKDDFPCIKAVVFKIMDRKFYIMPDGKFVANPVKLQGKQTQIRSEIQQALAAKGQNECSNHVEDRALENFRRDQNKRFESSFGGGLRDASAAKPVYPANETSSCRPEEPIRKKATEPSKVLSTGGYASPERGSRPISDDVLRQQMKRSFDGGTEPEYRTFKTSEPEREVGELGVVRAAGEPYIRQNAPFALSSTSVRKKATRTTHIHETREDAKDLKKIRCFETFDIFMDSVFVADAEKDIFPFTRDHVTAFVDVLEQALPLVGTKEKIHLNLFYEISRVLGFNINGHIFLNLASFQYSQAAGSSVNSTTTGPAWAVIIMHELAHNVVSGHGQDFILALHDIVAHALQKLI